MIMDCFCLMFFTTVQIGVQYFLFSPWQVFAINPADIDSRELLKMAEAFFVHNAPIRYSIN